MLSQFDLTVQNVPRSSNHLADAMCWWAYPAGGRRDDATKHRFVESFLEVQNLLEKKLLDRAVMRLTRIASDIEIPPDEPETERMALDLFAGTRSVANVLEEKGNTVINLCSDPKYMADIRQNILTRDYRQYPPDILH